MAVHGFGERQYCKIYFPNKLSAAGFDYQRGIVGKDYFALWCSTWLSSVEASDEDSTHKGILLFLVCLKQRNRCRMHSLVALLFGCGDIQFCS